MAGEVESRAEQPTQRGASAAPLTPSFSSDLLASVVVFLVALPLCMGIAIASGAPVSTGLMTGIVGGLVIGFLAGSPLQVSGPAAGLAVIVFDLVQRYGLEALGVTVLLAGLLQTAAGLLKLGKWFRAVSPAVIQGMLAGIGVLIFASQFHVMVDDETKGNGLQNLLTIPEAIAKGLPLPTWGRAETREAASSLLKRVGTLHEEQVQLLERVDERVVTPKAKGVAELDQQRPVPVRVQRYLTDEVLPRQRVLQQELGVLAAEIRTAELDLEAEQLQSLTATLERAEAEVAAAAAALKSDDAAALRATQARAEKSIKEILATLKNHDWAAKVGLLTIVLLVGWKTLAGKRLGVIPAPLVAVLVATIAAALLRLPVLYVEVPDNLWSEVHLPRWDVVRSIPPGQLVQLAVVLAVVASAETLLCAIAVDQMHTGPRTKYDRELFAQGIGNTICGTLGALPMTGVIVRSAANVEAGATSRQSAILHGLWLLLFVSLLSFLLRMIPTAALAAMLVYTGWKLVNVHAVRQLAKFGWGEVAIYLATVVTIVCTDLLKGVLVGIALSAAKLLYKFSHLEIELESNAPAKKTTLHLTGAATFVLLPRLAEALERVPDGHALHVEFQNLDYIDHACLDLLLKWAKQHESSGGTLVIDWETLHANFRGKPSRANPAGTSA